MSLEKPKMPTPPPPPQVAEPKETPEKVVQAMKDLASAKSAQAKLIENPVTQRYLTEKAEQQERDFLREEIQSVQEKYKKAISQYDELYGYCETLLADANEKRKHSEAENAKMREAIGNFRKTYGQLTERLKKTEEFLQKAELEKKNLAQSLIEHERELGNWKQRAERNESLHEEKERELRHIAEERRSFNDEVSQMRSQAFRNRQIIERAVRLLPNTIRTVEELCQQIDLYIEKISTKGVNQLTPKAGKILCEQLRTEMQSLKKLGTLFSGLSESNLTLVKTESDSEIDGHA